MSKKKKYHLKPFVKKLIILFIILVIIGFFIGRYLYKQHQLEIYHNSYEYKLIQLGYQEDYQLLLDTLSNDQLDVILTYPYNEFLHEKTDDNVKAIYPEGIHNALKEHLTDASREALKEYASNIETIDWNRDALKAMMKGILKQRKMKMPQVAMPLRLLLTGELHTPSIDAVVWLFGRETVLSRLKGL